MNKFMKLMAAFLVLTLLVVPAAFASEEKVVTIGGTQPYRDIGDFLMAENISGTGNIYYVDSGRSTAGNGTSWDTAKTTLDSAIALCTANNGDVILVAPGHAENLAAADAVDVDVAGVTIIGLGDGNARPTFTYTGTAGEFVIGAANITIQNLKFVAGISNITMGISVEAAGDNFTMKNCEVAEPGTATYDFATIVDLASGADNVCIENCEFNQLYVTAGDLDYGVKVGAGVCNNLTIKDCVIGGPFTVAAIWSDQIDKEVNISDNIISNITTGQMSIEFTANATGNIVSNVCYGDTEGAIIDGGACYRAENKLITAADTPGLPGWVVTNGLNHLVALDGTGAYPEQAANDSIIAKICASGATATCSTYDNTTDSLQAIRDRIDTLNTADQADIDAILADTSAMDTNTELQTLIFGSATGGADILADTAAMDTAAEMQVLTGTAAVSTTGITSAPVANTLADILHKDGSFTYDNTTDSLEAISDKVTTVDSVVDLQPRTVEKTDGIVVGGAGDPIFTVTGVVRCKITGVVTTIIGGSATMKLSVATTSPATTQDISAAAVAIDSDAVGTVYENIGTTAVFTPSSTLGFALVDPVTADETEIILTAGTVSTIASTAQTGNIKWYCTFTPLSEDGAVTAAP